MQFEYLFLAMVTVVLGAMLIGTASAVLDAMAKRFAACLASAVAMGMAAYVLAQRGGDEFAVLLAVAAGLFTLVIAFSASLLARRVLRRRPSVQ